MKLNKVSEWLNYESIEDYDPVPIKKLNEKIIFTDGHTRAFALYKMGIDNIRAYWDEDELDWDAYQICVDWCVEEGIRNISHLEQKVINNEAYEVLWYDRCRNMQKALEAKRISIDT